MSEKRLLSRRDFLRGAAMTAVGVLAASCAQPTPQVIEKPVTVVVEKAVPVEKQVLQTVVVEKAVPVPVEKIVKETVLVEKQVPVQVEKIVKETVIVEKPVIVEKVRKYNEAPMLAAKVAAGELPPVEERLPENPLVLPVIEQIGRYGGTWRRAYSGMSDRWGPTKIVEEYFWEYDPDLTAPMWPASGRSTKMPPSGLSTCAGG